MLESAVENTSSGSLPPFLAICSSAPYTMRSATDFLPRVITTFTNFATSWLMYLGSGRTSRLGTSLRLGMCVLYFFARWARSGGLRALRAVLRAALLAILHALRVQAAAHHVVAHAG